MMNKKETSRLGLAKYLLVLPVIAALLIFNNCDKNTKNTAAPEKETAPVTASEQVFSYVEELPQFPGGDAALQKWLSSNIEYPKIASEQGIQGKVVVRFIIRSDGSVDDVQIVKSLDPACDEEALRVIKMMPKWNPGKENGKAVSVYYNLPVTFKLEG
ncbi:hypothetical protein FACS1894177_00520 [Bacteroidia bacterium]|nr:hypothetical protein FACS1894177_00520 [Bacteroidia bacterium]